MPCPLCPPRLLRVSLRCCVPIPIPNVVMLESICKVYTVWLNQGRAASPAYYQWQMFQSYLHFNILFVSTYPATVKHSLNPHNSLPCTKTDSLKTYYSPGWTLSCWTPWSLLEPLHRPSWAEQINKAGPRKICFVFLCQPHLTQHFIKCLGGNAATRSASVWSSSPCLQVTPGKDVFLVSWTSCCESSPCQPPSYTILYKPCNLCHECAFNTQHSHCLKSCSSISVIT